ncbi:hypothetical protein P7M50_25235, partial [Vibrio parahaemolyticus]|nr:hypothetical protein [Vibrio parahaemolyticus]
NVFFFIEKRVYLKFILFTHKFSALLLLSLFIYLFIINFFTYSLYIPLTAPLPFSLTGGIDF